MMLVVRTTYDDAGSENYDAHYSEQCDLDLDSDNDDLSDASTSSDDTPECCICHGNIVVAPSFSPSHEPFSDTGVHCQVLKGITCN